ncbi:hypothetical protein [Photobacterium leiognathi]|uniref:hypothetical protein n=1 Tax=Photobacterium leiognathi TaxID=553611 RepID=UPI00020880CD|nr:hypothetical protein [Photobacterium leiognathi]PSW48336.1 hypothetical protein CTM83_20090 [Photobacterium leiognathi subsp. mandapamensis]GAA03229.1 putative uncharacterized protein [Photobacterium leiognathi subsp. mandapamensis svers.1.1.]
MTSKNVTQPVYHETVCEWLKESLPWLVSVTSYPEVSAPIDTPCAFFAVDDWERSSSQKTDGRKAMDLSCSVLLVYSMEDPDYHIKIRDAAMQLSVLIDESHLGLTGVYAAKFLSAAPNDFEPDLSAYVVWEVRFTQTLLLDKTDISAPIFNPGQVWVGYAPDVGSAHKDDYDLILDVPRSVSE